jgi:heme-degrading monooxygenase HmoA
MPALPFRTLQPPAEGREYVAWLTALPLQSCWAIPRFLRFTRQIQRQLQGSPGLLGYSLLARLWRRQFWTLSVWEDEQALLEFVEAVPHRTVMHALQPDLGETHFLRWAIRGDAFPPSWKAALARALFQASGGPPQ